MKSITYELDTTAPGLKVKSSPPARRAYIEGQTATFELGCTGEANTCSFECTFNGKNSSDAGDSSAGRGFFPCSHTVVLTIANSTTHSFAFRATDKSGNKSPTSELYMFYADGTAPIITFMNTATASTTDATLCPTKDTCSTVLQVPYNPSYTANEGLPEGYAGVVTASKMVNGVTTPMVLDTTSASEGTLSYMCTHPEFA